MKRNAMPALRALACALVATTPFLAHAALVYADGPQPSVPGPIAIRLDNASWPQYLPATRYFRTGNTIVVEYEYQKGATPGLFAYEPVRIGELVPGQYQLRAQLFDLNRRDDPPEIVDGALTVVPPAGWGVSLVPRFPESGEPANVVVHSAVYFDPTSMRATRSGSAIRVDFTYDGDAPVGSPRPAGFVESAAVPIGGLPRGTYTVSVYGSALPAGPPEPFFTMEVVVASPVPVFEFFQERLRHYFIAAGPDEIALLDAGGQGGWKRTGQRFRAWAGVSDAPPEARAACRFYAQGPNSHFFTADASECASLRQLETTQRASLAPGKSFLGWSYEGTGFYTLTPQGGQCPPGTAQVYRDYNNRAALGDSNHRFSIDGATHTAMTESWVDEGVQLCSPN